MRVYHFQRCRHTLYVSPASDPRGIKGGVDAEWRNDDGSAKLIEVCFDADGRAEVSDNLGRYLVATKQAKSTRLWLPQSLAA
jgi:hypothetical protein